LSLEDEAQARAELLDQTLAQPVVLSEKPRRVFSRLRAYLWEQSQLSGIPSNVYSALKHAPQHGGEVLISLGPTFVRGPSDPPFVLASGARLSFALTLRDSGSHSSVVAYSFRYYLPTDRWPEFLRFDLNRENHPDPLAEPRCHLHPGLNEVRLPAPVLDPFAVLDRIFFVVEPALLSP